MYSRVQYHAYLNMSAGQRKTGQVTSQLNVRKGGLGAGLIIWCDEQAAKMRYQLGTTEAWVAYEKWPSVQ